MFKRMLHGLILLVVVGYVLLLLLAVFSDRIIFQPQPTTYRDADLARPVKQPSSLGEGCSVVKLASGREHITAVYLPNSAATYTLLFSHGNAEDLGDDFPILEMFRNAGFAVFAYDYRGYGTSTGTPSENAVYQDALAAYDYLTHSLNVPPDRIISFGRSLGSAAAIEVAVQRPVAGLIVEAPFVSAFRMLTHVPLVPWDKFRNGAKIGRVRCPVLVIHGRADNVVPFRNGERIYALAHQPKQAFWVDAAGHNDVMFVAGTDYFAVLKRFADSLR